MPGRLKIRTTREQHQDGCGWGLVKQETKQLHGRWICPVQVFQNKEHRLMFSKFQEDGDDGFERLLTLTLWREVERRIAMFRDGQGEQRCKKLNRLCQGQSILAQRGFQFA